MHRFVVRGLASVALVSLGACGPSFPFRPSNVDPGVLTGGGDAVFNAQTCGDRAAVDTDDGLVTCFGGSSSQPDAVFALKTAVAQAGGPELTVLVAQTITVAEGFELQIRGSRPLVLAALDRMEIAGRIVARDSLLKYEGHGGGADEPSSIRSAGAGGGGGLIALEGTGAGGGSYCGTGGTGGDDAEPVSAGAMGGAAYGTADLMPLRGGSSGGRNGNHSGAGGGAVHLLAGNLVSLKPTGVVDMGGSGGGWAGNGGGSGGAILIEATTVSIEGVLAANGGGGGGGSGSSGQDGQNATGSASAAGGGTGGAGGGEGGAGSADTNVNGSPGQAGASGGGGGGGGAGRIRINSASGAATMAAVAVSPAMSTACATQGTIVAE